MIARIFLATVLACALSSCSLVFKDSGGKRIANFEERSIVYGWIDAKESGGVLDKVVVERLKPVAKKKHFTMGLIRHEGGYIVYHIGMPQGTYKMNYFTGHGCLVGFLFCNAGVIYDMPKQGSLGGVVVKKPGTYYMGAFRYKEVKTGFFKAAKFDMEKVEDGPSQQAMMRAIYDRLAIKYPEQMKRLESALVAKGAAQ